MASNPPRYIDPASNVDFTPITSPAEERKARREDVSTTGTETSTAVNAAKLPYVAPEAAASVENLMLRNQDLQRQLEKASKGVPLEGADKTNFETDVDAFSRLDRALKAFVPDFVGTVLDFPGQIESALQRNVSSKIGTPGQAEFWQEMNLLDMLVRNKYFGASLTPAEKSAYAETTITPGMTPELARRNLEARRDLLRAGIQRRVSSLRAGGYNPAQINGLLGEYAPLLNPRWMSPEQERTLGTYASSKDFDPAVYQQMLFEYGDANGVRIEPDAAAAAAASVAEQRAKGAPAFTGSAVYQNLAEPEDKRDEAAVGTATGGTSGPGGGGDGLGWGETLGSALYNLPSDTVNELQGIASAFLHPVDTATSVVQLGGGLLSMLGIGDFDQSTAEALGDYYSNKYGSMEGFKKELADHPASILSDVAVVFSGGAGAATKLGIPAKLATRIARMGPTATRAAELAAAAARNVDPITALANTVTTAVPAAVRGAGRLAGRATSGVLGATTSAGGQAVREAASSGYGRSMAGAPTAQADAFLAALRDPGATADDVVRLAQEGVANLRQQASQRYTATMQRFGKNPKPLDITTVQQRMAAIKPKSYNTWSTRQGPRPSDHLAWEQMNDLVNEYAAKAAADPSLLEPLAMDQFKQDLYAIGSKVGTAYDRDAARIAGTAYGAVKDELVKHDPLYADAMKDYETAAREAQQLESTFGLAAQRGKSPNIESAGRKLTSIFRNNVNTNYGSRAEQAQRLSELDPSGALMPSLAGQSLSSYLPRGIGRAIAGSGLSTGVTGLALDALPMALDVPGYISGYNLAALPISSPRLVGEAAYYGGRGAGAAAKALEPMTGTIRKGADWLADKQREYRAPLLVAGDVGLNLEAMQNPELQQLQEAYPTETPRATSSQGFAPQAAAEPERGPVVAGYGSSPFAAEMPEAAAPDSAAAKMPSLTAAGEWLVNTLGPGIGVDLSGAVKTPEGGMLSPDQVASMLRLPVAAWKALAASSGEDETTQIQRALQALTGQ